MLRRVTSWCLRSPSCPPYASTGSSIGAHLMWEVRVCRFFHHHRHLHTLMGGQWVGACLRVRVERMRMRMTGN